MRTGSVFAFNSVLNRITCLFICTDHIPFQMCFRFIYYLWQKIYIICSLPYLHHFNFKQNYASYTNMTNIYLKKSQNIVQVFIKHNEISETAP